MKGKSRKRKYIKKKKGYAFDFILDQMIHRPALHLRRDVQRGGNEEWMWCGERERGREGEGGREKTKKKEEGQPQGQTTL